MTLLFLKLLVLLSLCELLPVQSCSLSGKNKKPKTKNEGPPLQENRGSGSPSELSRKTGTNQTLINQRRGTRGGNTGVESKCIFKRLLRLMQKTSNPKLREKQYRELLKNVQICERCKKPKINPQSCNPCPKIPVTKTKGIPDPPQGPRYSTPFPRADRMNYGRTPSKRADLYIPPRRHRMSPPRRNGMSPPRSNGLAPEFVYQGWRYPEHLLHDPEFRRHMKIAGGVVLDAAARTRPPRHRRHGGHMFRENEDSSSDEQDMGPGDQSSVTAVVLPDVQSGNDPGPLTDVAQEALNQAATGNCDFAQLCQDGFKAVCDFLSNCGCCGEGGFFDGECLKECGECFKCLGECFCDCLKSAASGDGGGDFGGGGDGGGLDFSF